MRANLQAAEAKKKAEAAAKAAAATEIPGDSMEQEGRLEGQLVSRVGRLGFVCVSTREDIFLFDILSLGGGAFDYGLKSILQDEKIMKVFHDVRQPSDMLFHQYKVGWKLKTRFSNLNFSKSSGEATERV